MLLIRPTYLGTAAEAGGGGGRSGGGDYLIQVRAVNKVIFDRIIQACLSCFSQLRSESGEGAVAKLDNRVGEIIREKTLAAEERVYSDHSQLFFSLSHDALEFFFFMDPHIQKLKFV